MCDSEGLRTIMTINYQIISSSVWQLVFDIVNDRTLVTDPRNSNGTRTFVYDSDPLQKSFEFSGLPYIVLEIPTVEYGAQSPDANYAIFKWKLKLIVRTAKDGSAGTRIDTGRADMFTITDSLHKTFQNLTVKNTWRNNKLYSVTLNSLGTDTIVIDQRIMYEVSFEVNGSSRIKTNA